MPETTDSLVLYDPDTTPPESSYRFAPFYQTSAPPINAQESFLWDQTSYKSRNLLFCIFQESNEILVRIHELLLSCLKFEVKLLPSFEIVPRVLTDQRNEESAIDTPDKSNPTQLRNLRIVRYKL